MTQHEMDQDLLKASALLAETRLTVDRSRHESTTLTTLWIMDGAQIGTVKRLEGGGWEANRVFVGSPVTRRLWSHLEAAVTDITSQDPNGYLSRVVTQTRDDSRFRVVKLRGKVR